MYANDTAGNSWSSIITVDTTRNVGANASLEIVDGYPAIAYGSLQPPNYHMRYVRATTKNGSNWGMPLKINGTSSVSYVSMVIANGQPLITYNSISNIISNIGYVGSKDSIGGTWNIPQYIDVVKQPRGKPSMALIDNKPAISFYGDQGLLQYCIAKDTLGQNWDTAIVVDSSISSLNQHVMRNINGRPGIAFNIGTDLGFICAKDKLGTVWDTPVIIYDKGFIDHEHIDLTTIKGHPAIVFRQSYKGGLQYVRALDSTGSKWGDTVTLPRNIYRAGYRPTLLEIDGRPAASYFSQYNGGSLWYARAGDDTGGFWPMPIILDSGATKITGQCLSIIDGKPAIIYLDDKAGAIRYLPAADQAGITWNSSTIIGGTFDNYGYYMALQESKGVPVLLYLHYVSSTGKRQLKSRLAKNVIGTDWYLPEIVHPNVEYGPVSLIGKADQLFAACASNNKLIDFISGLPIPNGLQELFVKKNHYELELAPNPATNEVVISFDNIDDPLRIYVYNLAGQKQLSKAVTKGSKSIRISVSDFQSGLYLVVLESGTSVYSQKLMKH